MRISLFCGVAGGYLWSVRNSVRLWIRALFVRCIARRFVLHTETGGSKKVDRRLEYIRRVVRI